MRRFFVIVLVLLLALMCGCSLNRSSESSNENLEKNPCALYVSKAEIILGMSRYDIENILGEGKIVKKNSIELDGRYAYDELTEIYYRDGIAAMIRTGDASFCDYTGIKIGDNGEEAARSYGRKIERIRRVGGAEYNCISISYTVDNTGSIAVANSEEEWDYWMQYSLNEDGEIDEIFICDRMYGINNC